MVEQSLWVMLYGMGGVFGALAILAFVVKLMHWVFPKKDDDR